MGFHVRSLVSNPRITGGVRFIKGVGCEFFPVAPDFLKYFHVMTVCRSLFKEFRLHLVNYVFLFLTHCFSQSVAFASRKVCKLSRKKHHLLLIHRNSVGILQIFFHAGYVVAYKRRVFFSANKFGNIVHRSGAIQGIHGYQIFEYGGVQLSQIFLHACRFELERTYGLSFLVKFVSLCVVNWNCVQIHDVSRGLFHHLAGFLKLRKGFQPEEVHFN